MALPLGKPAGMLPGFLRGNPQLTKNGALKHLLSTEGLPRAILVRILDTADQFAGAGEQAAPSPLLRGKSVFNLFCEASQRTRASFESAARRLSAEVSQPDAGALSASGTQGTPGTPGAGSLGTGESLLDMVARVGAMRADLLVMRHAHSGAPYLVAQHAPPHLHVINAGDGCHAHPTRGLLDMYMIRRAKRDFTQLRVAIIGDIAHSRVARSDIHALTTLGVPEVRAIGPRALLPDGLEQLGVRACHDLREGLREVDVIIVLRLPRERLGGALPSAGEEYFENWGLTPERLALAAPEAIVLHGAATHRGIEIDARVAAGPQALMLDDARQGVAVHMAVMSIIAAHDG